MKSSSKSSPLESGWDDLLSEVTDAMLAEGAGLSAADIESITARYKVRKGEIDDLVIVMRRLRRAMRRVRPSRYYVYRLRRQLVGEPVRQYNVIARVRHLPPRVQIAAALALVAGAMWVVRRRARLSDVLTDVLPDVP